MARDGWTDQPNYRYPCCLGSPQEGHKPHCEAASQPVEDTPAKWKEPAISINGRALSFAQAMTVRVAVQNFAIDLQSDGLGEDDGGKRMADAYLARIREINDLMRAALSSVEDSAPTDEQDARYARVMEKAFSDTTLNPIQFSGSWMQTRGVVKLTWESSAQMLEAYTAPLKAELARAKDALPDSFFADRDLAFRVEMLSNHWKRALNSNHRLEDRVDELERLLSEARKERE